MPSNPTTGGAIATAPVESDESGEIIIADQAYITYVRHGIYTQLRALVPALHSYTSDGYKVIGARLTRDGYKGTLTINKAPVTAGDFPGGEGGTALPPDRWSLKPQVENVPMKRHLVYEDATAEEKQHFKTWSESSDDPTKAVESAWIAANGTADFKAWFALVADGHETFPLSYWRYTWVQHDTLVPPLSDGNLIQTPYGPGYPYLGGGLSWKREPDDVDGEDGRYVITRQWVGIPVAYVRWSPFLFS